MLKAILSIIYIICTFYDYVNAKKSQKLFDLKGSPQIVKKNANKSSFDSEHSCSPSGQ